MCPTYALGVHCSYISSFKDRGELESVPAALATRRVTPWTFATQAITHSHKHAYFELILLLLTMLLLFFCIYSCMTYITYHTVQ